MKKMRVCSPGFVATITIDLLVIFVCILVALINDKDFWYLYLVFPGMRIPFNVYFLPFSMDTVILNNKSITQYHFKKRKKEITWEKVHTVFRYDSWITISEFENITTNFWTHAIRFYDKRVICIPYDEDIDEYIYAHCGLRAKSLKETNRLF